MKDNSELEKKVEEMRILEQQLHKILLDKQSVQIEIAESANALTELSKTEGDVFRVLSNVMIKAEKSVLIKEIEEKKKILELKIKSYEKQENSLLKNLEELKKEVQNAIKNK